MSGPAGNDNQGRFKPPDTLIVQLQQVHSIVFDSVTCLDIHRVIELALPPAVAVAVNATTSIEQALPVPLVLQPEHLWVIMFETQVPCVKTGNSSGLH